MAWYDPRTWISSEQKVARDGNSLYCDNPEYQQPIKDDEVSYDAEAQEVTHSGECQLSLNASKCFQTGRLTYSIWKEISLERAIGLLKEGKLKQSQRLENKVIDV